MTQILFFEKPGCGGNARQKLALRNAGHELTVRSLLDEPWTRDSLLGYLAPLPVPAWFNPAAPRIKSGDVNPDALTAEAALALLLAEPLLIRRPLMQRLDDGSRRVGFDTAEIDAWVGLAPTAVTQASLEGCPRSG